MKDNYLYFDASATVPMVPEAIETIYNEMKKTWGNPSSIYTLGGIAYDAMEYSRQEVADYIGCHADEIIFTPSASAANNLALRGYIEANECQGYIITTQTEHKSVINTCEYLKRYHNIPFFYTQIDRTGSVDPESLERLLGFSEGCTNILVSVAMASSEIGTIQDIKSIAEIVHKYNGVLHVDATQCFTKMPIDVSYIDMMTVGGSKIGAGKGIGVLYKKKHIQLTPLIYGGGQEQGLIAGTEDVPKMCGFAKALEVIDYKSKELFREYFFDKILNLNTPYRINGHPKYHLDNLISISFKDKRAEDIVTACSMLGLFISAGSACNSGNPEPSMALLALDIPEDYINGTVRISFPPDVNYEDVYEAAKILKTVVDG